MKIPFIGDNGDMKNTHSSSPIGAGASRVRAAFRDQARICEDLGSRFTARVLRILARILTPRTAFGARILHWPGNPVATADALALRAVGALHALVLGGHAPALAALYPPRAAPEDVPDGDLERALLGAIESHDVELAAWLDNPPQTNEVARAALLYPGMMTIARRTSLPLVIFEIGASAGLNLVLDRYAYRLGAWWGGDRSSPLLLKPRWRGPSPRGPAPVISARRGCDIAPIDVTRKHDVARLMAYVWPDQEDRARRLGRALALARAAPPCIDRMEAREWVRRRIRPAIAPGRVRVLFHSLVLTYLSAADRAAICQHMEDVGRQATSEAPLAWLACELDDDARMRLRLRLWPGGEPTLLAEADAHGRAVWWRAAAA